VSPSPANALHLYLLVPGDPLTLTGGYLYDRRIAEGLRALGWQVHVVQLPDGFPFPSTAARAQALQQLQQLPHQALVLIDGLALGALPAEAAAQSHRLRLVGLVHHPLELETGLDAAQATFLYESERAALHSVRAVIVTSPETASLLPGYGVPDEHIHVIEPGTDLPVLSVPAAHHEGLSLLCVGTVTPRKGHELLLDALAGLRQYSWRLRCVGSLTRDAATAASVQRRCEALGLRARVEFVGELPDAALKRLMATSDLFVQASHFEGYGMALAEAIAHALPVVSTATGAASRLVRSDAGALIQPGDVAALQSNLQRALADPQLLTQWRDGARKARMSLRSWAAAAGEMATALLPLLPGNPAR
jgi:glycosyltransferase involved in cell wall biosynthesis